MSAFNWKVWLLPKWAIKQDVSSGYEEKHAYKSVVSGDSSLSSGNPF